MPLAGGFVSSSTSSVDDGISLRLRGGPEAGARARRALSTLRADIDPPLMETLRLLVTELVANSVRHARADTVVLKVLVGRSVVLTEVTDEGPGFDPADVPDPTLPENIERFCGRGLLLIRNFMTEVTYHGRGNMVTMTRLRNGQPE
jgi:anti-sigma regulatory factor (Ser/Thr protein kinase)